MAKANLQSEPNFLHAYCCQAERRCPRWSAWALAASLEVTRSAITNGVWKWTRTGDWKEIVYSLWNHHPVSAMTGAVASSSKVANMEEFFARALRGRRNCFG